MMLRHAETVARELRIIPCVDRVCVVATEVPAMTAQTPERRVPHLAGPHWNQISFLAEAAVQDPAEVTPRLVLEALSAADHAADQHTRRAALERLSAQLMQQAVR